MTPADTEAWYREARVRRAQVERLERDAALPFAPELLPYLEHDAVRALGEEARHALLHRALVRYLHGTSVLEVRVVNAVLGELAHGQLVELDRTERVAALQFYCDEGFHAVVASDLLAQLEVDEAAEPAPRFLALLERTTSTAEPGDRALVPFLFAVVTETSISQSLATLARSRVIATAVQRYVADHARDEARHAAFFAQLFARYWARCTAAEKARLSALLPALTAAFLGPPLAAIDDDLARVGLDGATRAAVLGEAEPALSAIARRGMRPVLACFARAGLDVPALFGAVLSGER